MTSSFQIVMFVSIGSSGRWNQWAFRYASWADCDRRSQRLLAVAKQMDWFCWVRSQSRRSTALDCGEVTWLAGGALNPCWCPSL